MTLTRPVRRPVTGRVKGRPSLPFSYRQRDGISISWFPLYSYERPSAGANEKRLKTIVHSQPHCDRRDKGRSRACVYTLYEILNVGHNPFGQVRCGPGVIEEGDVGVEPTDTSDQI